MERQIDPQIKTLLRAELKRQRETLSLIPSENIASPAVLQAMASVLTNKYSEGYPGHRYYGGNQIVDRIETLAITRVIKLFGADHANVQPHAGAIANLAVYSAVLKPGDKILAMDLRAGGHLTHGYKLNLSGQLYRSFFYGLDANGYLDYRQLKELAIKHRPKLIISGASAYPRQIDFPRISKIAKSVGALHLADIAHLAGLVAAGFHPSPVPSADIVTFTTHKTLRGPRGAVILCRQEFAQLIDRAVMPGIQGGPLDHIIAGKAQAFAEAARPAFRRYQQQTIRNAATMAETLMAHGIHVISGGTDNHLILADVTPLGLSGGQAEKLLEDVGLITNKNLIANDPRSPLDPSGIRLGTPSITSRGLKERDVIDLTHVIIQRLSQPHSAVIKKLAVKMVSRLTHRYPLYSGLVV
jgi:glycine hydroxymethyltransferase